jgi:single-stranded DNA-binding protein
MTMSLHSALFGTAIRDGEVRESKAGNFYGTVLVAIPNGTNDDGKDISQFVKIFAFKEDTPEIAKIKKGDRVYAEGNLTASTWESDKGPKVDLTLKAFHIRKTAIGKDRPRRENRADDYNQDRESAVEFSRRTGYAPC